MLPARDVSLMVRDTSGFELLHRRFAERALRAEYSHWERRILRAESSTPDPEHIQFPQQQSLFPIS
jgi:hypothetical protein